MHLTDKLVVVTGAASGIGRATALAFAGAGARVAACDVDRARLDVLAHELGPRCELVQHVDVSDRSQVATFAAAIHARGVVDILVNNAGVAIGAAFVDTSLDDWDWLLGVNLRGVIHNCHAFVPPMIERGRGGHIINIASILGIYAAPLVSAYSASKFAVVGLSRSLRSELAEHRIGVTAICPGLIDTGIVEHGRLAGDVAGRRTLLLDRFRRNGSPPTLVADAILDAMRTNPAVRIVGRDAAVMNTLTRVAPRSVRKLARWFARK